MECAEGDLQLLREQFQVQLQATLVAVPEIFLLARQ
jgi:hypothetical protein